MAKSEDPIHVTAEELAAYAAHRLGEADEGRVEVHLAECDECAELADELRLLGNAVRNWRARGYGDAYERACLLAALEAAEAESTDGVVRARLRAWRERWTGRAESAVGVIMEAPGAASRLFVEGLEGLVRSGGSAFELQPAGARRLRGPSLDRLGQQDLLTVADGIVSGPDPARVRMAVAEGEDQLRTTLEVDPDTGELDVSIDGWPPDRPPPLVLLRTEDRCVAVLTPTSQDGVLVARFTAVPEGTYVVQIEPVEGDAS